MLTNGSSAGLGRTSMNAIFMAVEMILATMADHILRAHLARHGTETQGRAGHVCAVELRATLASDGNLMARVETPL